MQFHRISRGYMIKTFPELSLSNLVFNELMFSCILINKFLIDLIKTKMFTNLEIIYKYNLEEFCWP